MPAGITRSEPDSCIYSSPSSEFSIGPNALSIACANERGAFEMPEPQVESLPSATASLLEFAIAQHPDTLAEFVRWWNLEQAA